MAATLSKKIREARSEIKPETIHPVMDGIGLVKSWARAKFDESVDVAVNLGVDASKSEQIVRGSVVLPSGTGRQRRVAVFADGEYADQARAAGADLVGTEDLTKQIEAGKIDFDVLIASPETMGLVGRLGRILGPRGLMPNPKVGTVTTDMTRAVTDAKRGQVQFRSDKAGIIHSTIGRASFTAESLRKNIEALLLELAKQKPATAKGVYVKQITLSSTMGLGVQIDRSTLPELG